MTGKLRFLNIFEPILIGETDIQKNIHDFFKKINKKKLSMDYTINSFILKTDNESTYEMDYEWSESGGYVMLKKIEEFGMTNISAYMSDILQNLNGRDVTATITEECLEIIDNEEDVYGVYYTNSNLCKIPDDKIKEICKIGSEDCCIFVCASGNGFECMKFDSYMSRQMLYRLAEDTINAKRIGNCRLLGRKYDSLNEDHSIKNIDLI